MHSLSPASAFLLSIGFVTALSVKTDENPYTHIAIMKMASNEAIFIGKTKTQPMRLRPAIHPTNPSPASIMA